MRLLVAGVAVDQLDGRRVVDGLLGQRLLPGPSILAFAAYRLRVGRSHLAVAPQLVGRPRHLFGLLAVQRLGQRIDLLLQLCDLGFGHIGARLQRLRLGLPLTAVLGRRLVHDHAIDHLPIGLSIP